MNELREKMLVQILLNTMLNHETNATKLQEELGYTEEVFDEVAHSLEVSKLIRYCRGETLHGKIWLDSYSDSNSYTVAKKILMEHLFPAVPNKK
jgi:hypothetical protein